MKISKDQTEYAVACLHQITESRGINQSQLETLSGVNQSTISKMFTRTLDPSFDNLKKLFQALGLRLADVLYETEGLAHDLSGYLATPLTNVVGDKKAESELRSVIGRIKEIAGSFTDPGVDLYWPGDHTHPVHNADFKPGQVYLMDRSRASTHDFIVLFCADPSYGVGQENEIATQSGLPGIRLAPSGVSRMMSGSFLNSINVEYTGSLKDGISFDKEEVRSALISIRRIYFKHRALYKNLNGVTFGKRLRKLVDERGGNYQIVAEDLGVSLPYLNVLMDEQVVVSNPSATLLKRMAVLLGTSVAYLVGESEETDPVWVESHATWRRWAESTKVDAGAALSIKDEWRHEYRQNRGQQTTASFRQSVRTMSVVDWDRLYQDRSKKKGGASGNGELFS